MSDMDAFVHFAEFDTGRLQLLQMQPEHAEALFTIKSNSEVTRRFGQEPHRSIADTSRWIERVLDGYSKKDNLFWSIIIKTSRKVVGGCTFWNFNTEYTTAELGYELHHDYWGLGIMSEALTAVLDYGFNGMGLHRVEALPLDQNEPSIRLLEKLGFRFEGTMRERNFFHGSYINQLIFAILQNDWKKS